MKRAILALAAVCGLSLCACDLAKERVQEEGDTEETQMETAAEEDPPKKEEKKKPPEGCIAVFLPGNPDRNWGIEARTLRQELEKRGYEISVNFASDAAQQRTQIEKELEKERRGLILAPLDTKSMDAPLKKAAEEGIPVLAYGTLPMNTETVDAYVTYDYYGTGKQIGEALAKEAEKNPGQILEIRPKTQKKLNEKIAFLGLTEALKQSFADETLKTRTDAAELPDIYCALSDRAAAAVEAKVQKQADGTFAGMMITIGESKANLTRMESGLQRETYWSDTETLAALAAKVADDYIRGKPEEKEASLLYDNGVKIVPAYLCPMVRVESGSYMDQIEKHSLRIQK